MLRLLWLLIVGNWPRRAALTEVPRCVGTRMGACRGTVSPLCWSGRCRGCCMGSWGCGCERTGLTKQEAEMVAEYRRSVGVS